MTYHDNLQAIICELSECCAQERFEPTNGRLMNLSMDEELCVLPSGANSLCVPDTAIRPVYYYNDNILV